MHRKYVLVSVLLCCIALISACDVLDVLTGTTTGSVAEATTNPGEVITVTGVVVDTIEDCTFDGICAYIIDSGDEGRYSVIWAQGMIRCEGDYAEVAMGQPLTAYGEAIDGRGSMSICASNTYYIRPN